MAADVTLPKAAAKVIGSFTDEFDQIRVRNNSGSFSTFDNSVS
jgi:hypothetical protein